MLVSKMPPFLSLPLPPSVLPVRMKMEPYISLIVSSVFRSQGTDNMYSRFHLYHGLMQAKLMHENGAY